MKVSLVVAMSPERVIGRDHDLPWHLPNDLRHFKALTLGKPVIMGRKTYESIGRPLPQRRNVVLSRDPAFAAPGCRVFTDLDDALERLAGEPEVMVIGGAAVYALALPRADTIYLTEVHATVAGDTLFPALDPTCWREVSRERHGADERHPYAYSFVILERVAR